jgi:phasin family protein
VGIFRAYDGVDFWTMVSRSQAEAENLSRVASKTPKRYGHGHEYIINHRRRDILVQWVRLLWAGTLVLNQRHGDSQPALISEGFPVMVSPTIKKIAKSNAGALAKSGQAAETIMKSSTEALTESGSASKAAVQDLTKAYQDLATKNAKNLTAAIQALSAVKNPMEFIELQQKLIKEGVEAAVSNSHHIAQLTTAVFTAAFEPVKKQIEAVQRTAHT